MTVPHVDPAHLAELALGNGVPPDDVRALRHIAGCERCREDLRVMTRIVTAVRSVEEADLPVAPPGRVWRRIERELAGTAEAAPATPLRGRPEPAGSRAPRRSPGAPGPRTGLVCCLLTGVLVAWWRRRAARPSGPAPALPPGEHRFTCRLSRRRGPSA
ncbi:hypothetical protein [Streptomyces sp. NPDC003719]